MVEKIIYNDKFSLKEDKFRTIDGSNNNINNPDYGSSGSALLDKLVLDYSDGVSSPAGQDRTNPRIISNAVGEQIEDIPSSRGLTNLIWAFGQFVDHDLTLVPDKEAANPILVPSGDRYLDPGNTGSVVIPIDKSQIVEGTGTSLNNPARLLNKITSWLDASNVYGSDEERASFLRTNSGGKLKVSSGNLLPFNDGTQENDDPRRGDPNKLFVAGDVRANENSVLVSMHALFVREHNRLADSLRVAHPNWTDEQIYQRAREINIAQYQNIVYNEYLPSLLGEDAVANYGGYDSSINPNIARVFANAAFRFGHSQLSSEILRLDTKGKELARGNLTLADVFFQPVSVVQQTGIDPILRGVASSLSQEVDTKVIDDVRNLLFGGASGAIGRDLLAINIERGRLNGVADYNTVRQAYNLAPVGSFAEITSDLQLQSRLKSVYNSVDNIDAIVGLLAEDKVSDGAVGETLQRILSEQFTALRNGDRFYYKNIFSGVEIAEIEDVTLSDIIRRNTNTTIIQESAFSLIYNGTNKEESIEGGLGKDTIDGNGGNDTIVSHFGDDVLSGGNGNDILKGGRGADILYGDEGRDKLIGQQDNDKIFGGDGNDILKGGNGDDVLMGDAGKDIVRAGSGNDTLIGGTGIDMLFGNGGSDTFVIESVKNKDCVIIRDYTDGVDFLQLSDGLSFADLTIKSKYKNTVTLIQETLTNQTLAVLPGIDSTTIDANSFIKE